MSDRPQHQPGATASERTHDGIPHRDTPVPGWWYAMLFATILWGVLSFMVTQWSPFFVTQPERLETQRVAKQRLMFAGQSFENTQAQLARLMGDSNWAALGASIYRQNCAACHGPRGGGSIGPNLCDDHWKSVSDITDIAVVITEGAAANAMPAWENRLSDNEIVVLSAYVASLRGSGPIDALAPEGDRIAPFPDPITPADQ